MRGDWGFGLSVPFVPRFYAVLQNYAKYAAPSLGWGHVIFMPIFGSFDVTLVTWAVCLILIGRENFCCAVIGWDLLEPPLLLTLLKLVLEPYLSLKCFQIFTDMPSLILH